MSPEAARLAGRMREIRDAAGLSLAQLARRTPYSKSSWARYLGGTQPVPRAAVEALCRAARVRPERLLALWELADARWSGRARSAPKPPAAPRSGRGVRHAAGAAAVLSAVLLSAALLAAAVVSGGGEADPPSRPAAGDPVTFRAGPGCTGRGCEGRDPVEMGCGGRAMVATLAERTAGGGRRVELRDGAACRAVWARATRLHRGDRVALVLPGAPRKEIRADTAKDREAYLSTPMTGLDPADDPRDARVCLIPADGREICFTG
ncbi:hypothetical protein GCM10010129_59860 [Streptomyces fumigatiscleroticus]|nr:hypothetical protein GCM10010129_59860 [Streptomyces fumigatiscleroticus]